FDHKTSWWEAIDNYYYHPETGATLGSNTFENKSLGERWRNSNYALHVGEIFGWPTKIIATICTLFFMILPISGFLIWLGRKRKKKKTKLKSTKQSEAFA
ncbi:MAG: PepSY-associated TM helix domain-containing protein, partial [Bacteroidota bacterium]